MAERKGRGGAREGAGRPPFGEARMVRCTVTLTPAERERLKELGGGNLSRGVRALLAAHAP